MQHVVGVQDYSQLRVVNLPDVIDLGDVVHNPLKDVLKFWFDGRFSDWDIHLLVLVPELYLCDPTDFVVVLVFYMSIMN